MRPKDSGKRDATFQTEKVKDEENGKTYPFTMQRLLLGYDDDGEEITSLVVTQPISDDTQTSVTSSVEDAQRDLEDETFIHEWVRAEVVAGRFPSANSLQGQLAEMKEQRVITQKRVRDAIHRLKAQSLLVTALDKSPSGNAWLRAVDASPHESAQT
jgi:hypothetical protein